MDRIAAEPPAPLWTMTPVQWRAATEAFFASTGLPAVDLVDRSDRAIPGPHGPIQVRIYRPRGTEEDHLPAMVYFHGGGMVTNTVDTYDALVQHLCAQSACVIVSVDYRLAPENKFPVPFDDAYAATRWLYENAEAVGIDKERFAVGGDSAGGLLAAAVTHMARDRGWPPITFQLLIYPAVGTRGHSASMAEFAHGYIFERDELDWVYTQVLNSPLEARDSRVCPISAADFSGLPRAFVVCAEYEIMRDDIEHYAALLAEAGVPTEVHRYLGQVHPFLNLAGIVDAGREAISECATKLSEALQPGCTSVRQDLLRPDNGISQSHRPGGY